MWKMSFIASAKPLADARGSETPEQSRDRPSFVIPLRWMHVFERQRLLIENRGLIFAGELPRGDVAEIFIVAPSLAVRRLIFFSKMRTAGFVAIQRVDAHQLCQLEEIGH